MLRKSRLGQKNGFLIKKRMCNAFKSAPGHKLQNPKNVIILHFNVTGTVMQSEKALKNDPTPCFKSILKILHSNYL